MVRASLVAERMGIRSISIVARGFVPLANASAEALGVRNLPLAVYPGVIMIDSHEEIQQKVENAVVEQIVQGLTATVQAVGKSVEPGPRDIVYTGTLGEVHEFFYKNLWTDGLPVIPPTVGRVEQFLAFTSRSPDEVIGVLPPEHRQASVWSVAVNGAMAGCRPEYMPILLAIVEALAEPEFRLEDAGSTPGWEPLVILNGPIVKELDFNYGTGVMRVGRQANSSVGRFARLYLRNVAGLRIPPGDTDKGGIGYSFNVALAENEEAAAEIGWEPFSVDRGFRRGENVVTLQSVRIISGPIFPSGERPEDFAQTIAEVFGQGTYAYSNFSSLRFGKAFSLLVVSPSIAKALARGEWTKEHLRRYLWEHVEVRAGLVEKIARQAGTTDFDICNLVEQGVLPAEYCQSRDPDRLIRAFLRPEWIGIVLAGDPDRNQVKGYVNNHQQGPPVSKSVALPPNWRHLLQRANSS